MEHFSCFLIADVFSFDEKAMYRGDNAISSYSFVSAALSFRISVLIGSILSYVFGFRNFGGDLFLNVLPPLLLTV